MATKAVTSKPGARFFVKSKAAPGASVVIAQCSKWLQTIECVHVAVKPHRAAGVQEDNVFALLKMPLAAKINQAGHALT